MIIKNTCPLGVYTDVSIIAQSTRMMLHPLTNTQRGSKREGGGFTGKHLSRCKQILVHVEACPGVVVLCSTII